MHQLEDGYVAFLMQEQVVVVDLLLYLGLLFWPRTVRALNVDTLQSRLSALDPVVEEVNVSVLKGISIVNMYKDQLRDCFPQRMAASP